MRIEPRLAEAWAGRLDSAPYQSADRQQATALVAALRQHIEKLDGTAARLKTDYVKSQSWQLGLAALDQHLPAQGLARFALHDVSPKNYGDAPAAAGFALGLALRRLSDPAERRPLLWCRLENEVREYGRLYGHGLESLGLPRARFLTVTLKRPMALYWTMEEALKSGALALVIGDAAPKLADLTTTRRLSLAALAGKSAGILVFTKDHHGPTASTSRWRVETQRSRAPPDDDKAPGAPAWGVELSKIRSGRPGAWQLEWHKNHAPHYFTLVSGISGGALHPQLAQSA